MNSLLGLRLPIIAAPMAGGPSTVALAQAVTNAGGLGFLAGGNKTAGALSGQIEQLRASAQQFGVNLFVPPATTVEPEAFRSYAERLQPEADLYGLELNLTPQTGDDEWREKVDMLVARPVPVVSLTFGLPPRADIEALQAAGSVVLATVTSPKEAIAAAALGVEGLTVQGYRAGGHSAVHDPGQWPMEVETAALLRSVREVVELPLIAAGGIDGPAAVRELMSAGAVAVAAGTMFLRTDEAGTTQLQKTSMVSEHFTETALTRAFTGRPARGLRNEFIDRHHAAAPVGYPEVHYLTRELRAAAGHAGDVERFHMWAGTGFRSAPESSATEVVRWLVSEL